MPFIEHTIMLEVRNNFGEQNKIEQCNTNTDEIHTLSFFQYADLFFEICFYEAIHAFHFLHGAVIVPGKNNYGETKSNIAPEHNAGQNFYRLIGIDSKKKNRNQSHEQDLPAESFFQSCYRSIGFVL